MFTVHFIDSQCNIEDTCFSYDNCIHMIGCRQHVEYALYTPLRAHFRGAGLGGLATQTICHFTILQFDVLVSDLKMSIISLQQLSAILLNLLKGTATKLERTSNMLEVIRVEFLGQMQILPMK